MTTKNLARTVIEGGRTGSYKTEVALSARAERSESREYLRQVTLDPDVANDISDPVRTPVRNEFADKTSPLTRYLESRVGKPWSDTYSEIRERFDVRTTPGRHIVNDHLLSDIALPGSIRRYSRFHVDDAGILRKNSDNRFQRYRKSQFDPAKLLAWLGNRKVGQQGARLVWWVPLNHKEHIAAIWYVHTLCYAYMDDKDQVRQIPNIGRSHYQPATIPHLSSSTYRPTGLLKAEDEKFFRSLPEQVQEAVLSAAPSHGDAYGTVHHNAPLPRYW